MVGWGLHQLDHAKDQASGDVGELLGLQVELLALNPKP